MATLESRLNSLATSIGTDVKGLTNIVGVLANLSTTDKTNLVNALNEIKTLGDSNEAKIGGSLANIGTAVALAGNKTAVEALTSLQEKVVAAQSSADTLIDDAAIAGATTTAYSADKIITLIDTAKSDILGGIPSEDLDTIKELAEYLTDGDVASGLVQQLAKRVRVDAVQSHTAPEQVQARENIDAASNTAFQTLSTNVGDTDADIVAAYTAAKV
jgi:hypothetical protein